MRQYVREKNRREKATLRGSTKLLRTVDPRERQRIATPLNSARTTPANPTPIVYRTPVPTPAVTRTPARALQDRS
ncbi:hypothetical protein L916_00483 [Phytophthora nicotianae]|uniref:Uncharacterized protein n=1 Tax=Phytophthora nicotianae TaxID=4792 RepID=W2JV53_PHYNI|nr:hypothetical protein L916_00483 [Phytophthora nicotianae]